MINGDINKFIEIMSYGGELVFLFDGKKYFLQGWSKGAKYHMALVTWEPWSEGYLWKKSSKISMQKLADEFVRAPLFDGKTFWEVEREIEWVDC